MKTVRDAAREIETARPPSMPKKAPAVSGTYSTRQYVVDVEDLAYEEDELTPIRLACLVCKGHGSITRESANRYSSSRCEWCTDGTMTGEQVNRYLSRDQIRQREVESLLRRYIEE